MRAHLEQYAQLHHKCHGDAVHLGKGFPGRVESSTKIEILCSTMDLGMTGEGGRRYYKLYSGQLGYTIVASVISSGSRL
jgi:hypothetical protein